MMYLFLKFLFYLNVILVVIGCVVMVRFGLVALNGWRIAIYRWLRVLFISSPSTVEQQQPAPKEPHHYTWKNYLMLFLFIFVFGSLIYQLFF